MLAETIATRIREAKEQEKHTPADYIALFPKELNTLYTSEETATILGAISGRSISTDYVKLLRLKNRLPAGKKVNERAYMYRLLDILAVTFRSSKSNLSDSVKIGGKNT